MKKLLVMLSMSLPLPVLSQGLGLGYNEILSIIYEANHIYTDPSLDNRDSYVKEFLQEAQIDSLINQHVLKSVSDKERVWISAHSEYGWMAYGFDSKKSYCNMVVWIPGNNKLVLETIVQYNMLLDLDEIIVDDFKKTIIKNSTDWKFEYYETYDQTVFNPENPDRPMGDISRGTSLRVIENEFIFYNYYIKP